MTSASLAAADILRFAFVEYESRRDADDAYHEMHNRSISRSEVLKIEVRTSRFLDLQTRPTGTKLTPTQVGSYSPICILALRLWLRTSASSRRRTRSP